MLSGITPRDRALRLLSACGSRLSRPLESCENDPAAEMLTVLPETLVFAPQTETPAGRADVPQRSITRKGASEFGGMFFHMDAGAWKPVVRRCSCPGGTVPEDPIL